MLNYLVLASGTVAEMWSTCSIGVPFPQTKCLLHYAGLLQTPYQQCFVAPFELKLAILNTKYTENVKTTTIVPMYSH